jgi:hemolysin D
MEADGRTFDLGPGMAVTAEVKTGSRRIIGYLLSPIAKYRHDVLRER